MLSLIFWAQISLKKKKKNQAKSGRFKFLYPRLRLVSLREPDWHLENSRKEQNNSLPKVNTILTAAALEMPAICCPSQQLLAKQWFSV